MLANLVLFDKPTIIITALALARPYMGQTAALEIHSSRNKQYAFMYIIHRILSAGWGFPVWAAAALMRAIRLRLTE